MENSSAKLVMERIEALAKISEESGRLTRTYGSSAMRCANDLVAVWMREAGMEVRLDAIGNLIGIYPGNKSDAKILLLGSHLDTVRDAGKFDGPLGVLVALAAVQTLHDKKITLPFAIEIVGFCDEEGVRFQSTYLGSKAVVGTLSEIDLQRCDADGISVAQAIKNFGGDVNRLKQSAIEPKNLIGYLEVHIEQGPVLESQNLALGIVTAIAGQTRLKVNFTGRAGHAGTTPMNLRRDALCAAAEFVLHVESLARETSGLVATAGQIQVEPGASNVIPSSAKLTVDIRHQDDSVRRDSVEQLRKYAGEISQKRGTKMIWEIVQENSAVLCDELLKNILKRATEKIQEKVPELPSGAGHDAAVMASITPMAMLFARCKGGVSHHPDESVETADVEKAIVTVEEFLKLLAMQHG